MPSSAVSSLPLTDSLFLSALRGENRKRPPVWIMRQAGRFLPEYRKIREKVSLEEMFSHPQLIAKITKLPIELIGFDAAILFADILHVPKMLGFNVTFPMEGGPTVFPRLEKKETIATLKTLSSEEVLPFVKEGILLLKKELSVPLIGFAGGPFTVASYLIDEKGGELLRKTKQFFHTHPKEFHNLLALITRATIDYLKMQAAAGVDALQIFDSWAGLLPKEEFCTFSLPYLKKIIHAMQPHKIPLILFCRGSSFFAEQLASLQPNGISFDHFLPLKELRLKVPLSIAIQGNLDPDILRAPLPIIEQKTKLLLQEMKGERRFIANLGHGVAPDILPSHVQCFVDTIKAS
ncbi:MAG: uroporphyrinogen decarboxylase [Simkania negevensis]|nr:uroporphyrinogen decarboxylase [Simkania negevensis]